jgi:serine/threonine protein kinase
MIANPQPNQDRDLTREVAELQSDKWQIISATYLPVKSARTIWRYSRVSNPGDLSQGWKLHLSATILSANQTFLAVAPYLRRQGVLFKAPHSLRELQKLNSGLHYGYCQVGKFITVYPRSTDEALRLARRLHHLTRDQPSPTVPFDSKFRAQGSVYYRYGSFKSLEIENPDGTRTSAVEDPEGNLVPDLRVSDQAKPNWVVDPFVRSRPKRKRLVADNPLKRNFRAFQSLVQRGKGGVYKAFDFRVNPPRLCILKEGRPHGEVTWEGRDGYWLTKHEEEILITLRAASIAVPEVYSSFEMDGNYYLVTEFIYGETLQNFLAKRQRRLSLSDALQYAVQLFHLLIDIHATGLAWRDCKPANLMVTRDGRLRPVDFEGACSTTNPDPMSWSTLAFAPPGGARREMELTGKSIDLYGLGAVIYFLLTGRLPEGTNPAPLATLRRGVSQDVCKLVRDLMNTNERSRHRPEEILQRLKALAICA